MKKFVLKVTLEGVLFDEKYAKLMQVIFLKGTAALVFYLKFCENSYRRKISVKDNFSMFI